MASPNRKLAVLNLGAHGHINPTLSVVRELVARGVDVAYFAPPEFEASIIGTGARFVSYVVTMGENNSVVPWPTRAEFIRLVEGLSDESPDALIYDSMCLAGRFAASILSLPTMIFRPSYAANEHFSVGRQFDDAESLYGWPAPVDSRPSSEPLNIVFMSRGFHPAGATFDERFVFAGPSIASRPSAGTWTPRGDDDRPLLFVSMGTVANAWPAFFSICFEALAAMDWQVLIAVGNGVDIAALGPVPGNVTLERRVPFPQLDVLAKARLFITHGGMNSAQESLWFGVPMIVIPRTQEQTATARRVEELGLGKAFLSRGDVTASKLADAVTAVDSDAGCRRRVAAMQRDVRDCGGYERAADAIVARLDQARSRDLRLTKAGAAIDG